MPKNNVTIAEAYYIAMSEKNIENLAQYLHSNVEFTSPFAKVIGKDALVEWIKKFITFFETLTIRAKFESEDQAMIVYDLTFPVPLENCPAAALLTIKEELITTIELFFDGRPFDKK